MRDLQINNNNQSLALPKELLTSTTDIISAVITKEKSLPVVVSKISDAAIAKAGGGTQISKFKRETGLNMTKMVIASLVYDLRDAFNTKNDMTDSQVKMLVEIIVADYWHLKIEQIARAFHLQKMGDLLKVYDRLDIETVLKILDTYEQNKSLPEQRADALYHKEFIEERESSTGTKAAAEELRQAMNRYLIEKGQKK